MRILLAFVLMLSASAGSAFQSYASALAAGAGESPPTTATAIGGAGQDSPTVVALLHVNVIPMDRERVLTDQTVIVRRDRIATIGPATRTTVPDGATRIEARGRYLMPGLAEMHCHLVSGANQAGAEVFNRRIMLLNLMYGVTTVRGMLGHASHLSLRERVAKGEVVGPTIYTSGPSFNGNSAPTPEVAVKMVQEQKAAGYDFLKIHPGLSRATFDALAATADKEGIRFAGHVPADVGLIRALEARYDTIDHIDGYMEALAAGKAAADQAPGFFGFGLVNVVDESRIPDLVQATKKAGTAIVPTEAVVRSFLDDTPPAEIAKRPQMQLMPPPVVEGWRGQKEKFNAANGVGTPEIRAKYFGVRAKLLKALHGGGVKLLLGADSPQIFAVPGYAIHRELELMVAAGLTPYQALESGTRHVAEHFGTAKDRGTLEVSKVADAVLVEANPLADIANASKVTGVLLRGRWLPKSDLEKQVAALTQ
jgi:imidazolonepropionase-like amidohydrolase